MSDLISRDAVIDWFRCYGHTDEPIPFETLVSDLRDAIPSVNAAPVVYGRWEHLGGDEWCCTQCGYVITTEGSWERPTAKYCEECGARMDRKEGADNEAKTVSI